jgi:hypothetical protein
MSSFGKGLLFSLVALGLSGPAFAQPKADAGSGPTSGAASANDAGSGPTTGAKTKYQRDNCERSGRVDRERRWRHTGSKINWRVSAGHACDAREEIAC